MEEKALLKRKEKCSSNGNCEQLALCCHHLGDFYNQQGKYQKAVGEYQQEAELYAKLGKQLEMARAHRMVGEMFMLLCEFRNAKNHINLYLVTVKKLQNKVEEQRAYATLGRAHLLHGQSVSENSASTTIEELKQAEKAFLKSLLLIKELSGQISKLEQLDMQARCYLNIGVVKEHMEKFEESITYIEKAIKISTTHDIYELTHLCYISMSLLYHCKKNDATLALRFCNLALEIAKRLPNKVKKICETLITKSEILIKEGDFSSAKQILVKAYKKNTPDENDRNTIERSLRIVVKICQTLDELITTASDDYEKRKKLYERLGDGCCHLQNYTKALEYYNQMLQCAQLNSECGKSLIPIYVSLYQTYKDTKQYDKALEYLWKEYELNKDTPSEAFTTLCGIAEVCELQMQSFWTIHDVYQKAKEQAEKAGHMKENLEKIVYARLRKLQLKHKMYTLAEELEEELKSKGIDPQLADEESDNEYDQAGADQNTPELGDDICLDDLTDSDTSDLDETEKARPCRATRGTRLAIKRNNKGETQLHQACIAGNFELVRRLLDQGHVANIRDHAGWLPLHEACNHGFRDIVELLLDRGAAVAINDKGGTNCDGITPLYDACSNGYLDVVELLLERGADATVKTDFGDSCISGLDKWRRSATLTEGEQAHYTQIRTTLLKPLSRVGIVSSRNDEPLTNKNVELENDDNNSPSDASEAEEVPSHSFVRRNISLSGDDGKILKHNLNKSSLSSTAPVQRTASMEYKNVMEQLKHPNRTSSSDLECVYPSSSSGVKQKRSALLQPQEVDDDTWLIDDVGPEKKKRRYHTPTKDTRSVRKTLSKESLNETPTFIADRNSRTPDRTDAFQLLLEASLDSGISQQRKKSSQKLHLSRLSSISSNSSVSSVNRVKPKYQASLLDSGFCRVRSDGCISSEDSSDATSVQLNHSAEPDSTTTSIHLLLSPSKTSPIKVQAVASVVSPMVSFKVKVEDELLLVPVERKKLNEINMRWLAEAAARRYYNLVGLKPRLRLKTVDGFAYEENDTVNVAVEQNMILATVLEWKISPLPQRYEEMCQQLNKDVNTDVRDILEQAQITNIINFEDFWLTPQLSEPIFKSLLHQMNLRVLDISNNFIRNEGCQQLAKSLPTLKQLKALNLKGNFITGEGLEALFSGFLDSIKLDQLEELNLSYNPLGNGSIRILDKICHNFTGDSLVKLVLSNCQITNLYDYDLCYYQLCSFDISYNLLTDDALHKVLTKLNACRLQELNLSYTKPRVITDQRLHTASHIEYLIEFFESGTCEKFKSIELCGCHLNDANIYKLVQCLHKAVDMELLDLSDNDKLSGAAFHFILQELPQLRKLVATNCRRFLDKANINDIAQLKHLPNLISLTLADAEEGDVEQLQALWKSHWHEKAHIRTYEKQMLLYTNDQTLLNY